MNAVNNIRNRRSGRLYINSAYAPAHLIMNFKVKSARVPRRGVIESFRIFGETIKDRIRDILHRL